MTIIPYTALVARLDAARQIAYLRDLAEPGSMGTYNDEWPLHFAGYDGTLALAVGDAVAFVAQLNKYDVQGRRVCTDLPSLSAERDSPHGTFIDPPMREVTLVPPLTYRLESPTEIIKQERLVQVFHLPGWADLARTLDQSRIFRMAHASGALDELEGSRSLRDAGWRPVYYAEWHLVMPVGLIHVRVTFMRPLRPDQTF